MAVAPTAARTRATRSEAPVAAAAATAARMASAGPTHARYSGFAVTGSSLAMSELVGARASSTQPIASVTIGARRLHAKATATSADSRAISAPIADEAPDGSKPWSTQSAHGRTHNDSMTGTAWALVTSESSGERSANENAASSR